MSNENSRVSAAIQQRACCCGMWGLHSFTCVKNAFLPPQSPALSSLFITKPIKHFPNSDRKRQKKKMKQLILLPQTGERRRGWRGGQKQAGLWRKRESRQSWKFDQDKRGDGKVSTQAAYKRQTVLLTKAQHGELLPGVWKRGTNSERQRNATSSPSRLERGGGGGLFCYCEGVSDGLSKNKKTHFPLQR